MQRLKELWKRKWLRGVALVFILALTLLVLGAMSRPRAVPEKANTGFEAAVNPVVEIRAFASSFTSRIEAHEKKILGIEERLKNDNTQLRQEIHALLDKLSATKEPPTMKEVVAPEKSVGRLRTFAIDQTAPKAMTFKIPAGSFASCTLLTGIYAPTTGEPLPVLLRVDELAIGPNKSRVPVKGAFLVGKAQGDSNSKRAIVQLTALSLVAPSGEAFEVAINGYLADSDGIQGTDGEYVYRVGDVVGVSGLAAGLEGLSDTFTTAKSTRLINPPGGVTSVLNKDVGESVGLSASSRALSKLSEVFTKRLDEVIPAIYVTNGRRVTAVLLSSVNVDGFDVGEVKDAENRYRGLDAHR